MKSIENNKINKKIEEKKLKGNIVPTSNSQKRTIVTIVKGKGNKSRMLPIGQYATFYIQLYLEKGLQFIFFHRNYNHLLYPGSTL